MKRIDDKDQRTGGGTKKVIRFLKNLKADGKQDICLSSYDIASLGWHFSDFGLIQPVYRELALVAVTQVELNAMCRDFVRTSQLEAPDGSRRIIDNPEKFTALLRLSAEADAIALDVAKEIDPLVAYLPERIRPALEEAVIH